MANYTVLILGSAFIFLIAFFIVNRALTYFRLKNCQKEWDELIEMLTAFAPYMTHDELKIAYVKLIDEIKCYYSRF